MQPQPTNEVSAEPESKMWEAYGRYMRGDIDLRQLEAIEKTYRPASSESASFADYYASAAKSGISGVVDNVVDFMCNLVVARK